MEGNLDREHSEGQEVQMPDETINTLDLSVRNLRKSFVPGEVLQGMDLTLRSGEVQAILCENGAGKVDVIEDLLDYDRVADVPRRPPAMIRMLLPHRGQPLASEKPPDFPSLPKDRKYKPHFSKNG